MSSIEHEMCGDKVLNATTQIKCFNNATAQSFFPKQQLRCVAKTANVD